MAQLTPWPSGLRGPVDSVAEWSCTHATRGERSFEEIISACGDPVILTAYPMIFSTGSQRGPGGPPGVRGGAQAVNGGKN